MSNLYGNKSQLSKERKKELNNFLKTYSVKDNIDSQTIPDDLKIKESIFPKKNDLTNIPRSTFRVVYIILIQKTYLTYFIYRQSSEYY